ncbi:MAG: enoyl-CoA hydratase/isomerase family protein, partial [Acidimicrobiia bacterium]
ALQRAGEASRAAVITGQGKAFCSGADLRDLLEDYEVGAPDLAWLVEERFNPVARAVAGAQVPTVAALNGAAAGAGMGLALACDLRVMAEDAYFTSAFINVALIPDTGSSWYLAHTVGLSRALEIAYSGRKVAAQEALGLGMAHAVTPPEDLELEAISQAGRLANGPTGAYVATRLLLRGAATSNLDQALAEELRVQGELGARPSHVEGVKAFLEKRSPDFRSMGS